MSAERNESVTSESARDVLREALSYMGAACECGAPESDHHEEWAKSEGMPCCVSPRVLHAPCPCPKFREKKR